MNSLVGAGILGLPFVYPSAGLIGGILLQFVSCLFLQDFGTMLNYLIIIGDSSFKIISIWGYDTLQYSFYH